MILVSWSLSNQATTQMHKVCITITKAISSTISCHPLRCSLYRRRTPSNRRHSSKIVGMRRLLPPKTPGNLISSHQGLHLIILLTTSPCRPLSAPRLPNKRESLKVIMVGHQWPLSASTPPTTCHSSYRSRSSLQSQKSVLRSTSSKSHSTPPQSAQMRTCETTEARYAVFAHLSFAIESLPPYRFLHTLFSATSAYGNLVCSRGFGVLGHMARDYVRSSSGKRSGK